MLAKHASCAMRRIFLTKPSSSSSSSRHVRLSPFASQALAQAIHSKHLHHQPKNSNSNTIRCFQTESDYHNEADRTLNIIQDTLDYYFEDNPHFAVSPDINFASGVLTVAISPSHGTWVLNKQTPNRQIWWSSPVTGPRRYEFEFDAGDSGSGKWIWSRYVDFRDANTQGGAMSDGSWDDTKFLGESLKKEMVDIFHLEDGLEELDDL